MNDTSSSSALSSDFYERAGKGATSTSAGPLPGSRLAARIADLTPDLQVCLSWGSIAESFHSLQSLSVSCFHVILGLPGPRFPSNCRLKAVLTAPLERSACPFQRNLLSFRMRSRFSMPSRATYLTGSGGDNILRLDIADLSDHCPFISLQPLKIWQTNNIIKKKIIHCLQFQLCHQTVTNTVDSRYLEFQGTLWNTSRYPYFDISDLQNRGKN